jgi:putative flippase GtrA
MQFILYCVCGGIGVLSDFSIYYLAVTLGVSYQIANGAGYLLGTLVSFALNRKITFNMQDQMTRRLTLFLGVAGIGFLASAALLWILIEIYTVDARIAKLTTLPVVVILQFSLNRWITFRQKRNVSDQ